MFDDDTPRELVARVKPTVLVEGGDYSREEVLVHEIVEALGGQVVLVDLVPRHSTTLMFERLRTVGQGRPICSGEIAMKLTPLLMCGICFFSSSWPTRALDAAPTPQNYRQLIADSDVAKTLRDKLNLLSPLAVSQLRPSVLTQPGDWNVCVRVSSAGFKTPPAAPNVTATQRQPALPRLNFYAFFFTDGAVVDSRPAVSIDRCADVTYSPLPALSKKKKPN